MYCTKQALFIQVLLSQQAEGKTLISWDWIYFTLSLNTWEGHIAIPRSEPQSNLGCEMHNIQVMSFMAYYLLGSNFIFPCLLVILKIVIHVFFFSKFCSKIRKQNSLFKLTFFSAMTGSIFLSNAYNHRLLHSKSPGGYDYLIISVSQITIFLAIICCRLYKLFLNGIISSSLLRWLWMI